MAEQEVLHDEDLEMNEEEDNCKEPEQQEVEGSNLRPGGGKAVIEKLGEHEFEFRGSDSLCICVKNRLSHRLFIGKFSKQTLLEMRLTQSVPEIISIIGMAINKSKKLKCEFKIAFSSKNETISPEQMSEKFQRGDALYMIVMIREPFWKDTFLFKCDEQQRKEIDIQGDIIEDLRAEIKGAKTELQQLKKPKINPMVVLKCNTPGNPVPWNVTHIASNLQGMATTQDSHGTIVIGIAGRYKISARFGFNTDWDSTLTHDLQLNGTTIAHARTYYGHSNTFDEVRQLNAGDKLVYKLNSTVSNDYWSELCNHFCLEYLGAQ
jgi:hypothetical protein